MIIFISKNADNCKYLSLDLLVLSMQWHWARAGRVTLTVSAGKVLSIKRPGGRHRHGVSYSRK